MKLEGVFISLFSCPIVMANIQHNMINLGEKVGQIRPPRFPSGSCNVFRSFCLLSTVAALVSAVAGNHPVVTGSSGAFVVHNLADRWVCSSFFAQLFRSGRYLFSGRWRPTVASCVVADRWTSRMLQISNFNF